MNAQILKKITTAAIITSFVLSPLVTFAQTPPRAVPVDEKTLQPINLQTTQAGASLYGSNPSGVTADLTGTAGSFATCAGLGALSGAIQKAISEALAKAFGEVVSTEVPAKDSQQRAKESGTSIAGVPILPSWDQVGWCAINSVIESLGAATVAWINSGFQGNPAFVEDPEQFFADVADIQAGIFLNELSSGLLCTPIQNWVRINIASNYNSSLAYAPQCSFSAISGNLEQFMSGETFSWTDWLSYTQNPNNNPFGATLGAKIELDQRIAAALGTQSKILDWGGGFLSYKNPETGKITSPGSVIQDQLNQRLFSGQKRLEIADEFDEVVTALVNQLIKVAITEMTQSGQ